MEQVLIEGRSAGLGNGSAAWSTAAEARISVGKFLSDLSGSGEVPVWAVVYASSGLMAELRCAFESAGAWKHWPLMVLNPEGECGGIQTLTLTGGKPECLRDRGRVVGMRWIDSSGGARASICGLVPASGAPAAAALDTMERAAGLLESAGLAWPDVYRTWYYNDRLLDWYGEFNRTRRDYYQRQGVSLERPPASTGIGIANGSDAPLTLGLLALRPGIQPGPVPSPLQDEPAKYGSFFSRASEETLDGVRTLWISGTASIHHDGETLHEGKFETQVVETHRIVDALLHSRSMRWADVRRATVYIREPGDLLRYHRLVDAGVVPDLNAVAITATVCRNDLLFEIELEASL